MDGEKTVAGAWSTDSACLTDICLSLFGGLGAHQGPAKDAELADIPFGSNHIPLVHKLSMKQNMYEYKGNVIDNFGFNLLSTPLGCFAPCRYLKKT